MDSPQAVRTYVDTFTAASLDVWFANFTLDGTFRDPHLPEPTPVHGLKEHFAALFVGFPDFSAETVSLAPISADLWVWRWIMRGTNTGPFRGAPPTGRTATMAGCEFIAIRGDKVRHVDAYFDRLTMLRQLNPTP
jgi:predicted ester cyclase